MILEILLPTISTLIIGFVGALAVKKILIVVRYETQNGFNKKNHEAILKILQEINDIKSDQHSNILRLQKLEKHQEKCLPKKKKQKNENIRVMPLTRKEIKKIKRKGIT